MTDLPGISTYSNVAYDMVKYRTEAGEVGEDGTGGSSGDDTLQKVKSWCYSCVVISVLFLKLC